MSTPGNFDWLDEQLEKSQAPEAAVDIPSGDFTRGFVGEWEANMMYKLYTTMAVDLDAEGVEIPYDFKIATKNGSGQFYYWKQTGDAKTRATEAAKLADKRSANRVWRWSMPIETMLNYSGDDAAEKFGPVVAVDTEVYGLISSRRTDFHLLFLPSFVQSMALYAGVLDAPVFAYDQMIFDAGSMTQEYADAMVGPMKEDKSDAEFEKGELWRARTALWKALGEDEPKLWSAPLRTRVLDKDGKPTGEWKETPFDPKTDVTSELMKKILRPMFALEFKIWGRLTRVAAPRMPTEKELLSNQKPFGANVVSALWRTREEAIAATGVTVEDFPPMPAGWSGTPARDFKEWFSKYIEDNFAGKPKPLIIEGLKKQGKSFTTQYAVTMDEVTPWVEFIKQ